MQQDSGNTSKKRLFSFRDIPASLVYFWPSYVCTVAFGAVLLILLHEDQLFDSFPYFLFGIAFALLGCLICNTLTARSVLGSRTGLILSLVSCAAGAAAGSIPYLVIRLFPYLSDSVLLICMILCGCGILFVLLGFAHLSSGLSVRHLFWVLLRAILYEIMTSILSGGLMVLYLSIHLLFGSDLLSGSFVDHFIDGPIILYTVVYPLLCFPVLAEKQEHEYPKFLYYFFICGVVPLLSAFTTVFYVYLIRILVLQRFPSNEVAPLVLFGSAVGIIVTVFLLPQREKTPAKWFLRIFPIAWLLPLGMYFMSVFIRVNAYGFTPERVLLVLFGLWMILFVVAVSFIKKCTAAHVILSFALIFSLAVAPPASLPFRLSKADQTFRLKQAIAQANLGSAECIEQNPGADPAVLLKAISSAQYLAEHTNVRITASDGTIYDGTNTEAVFGVSEYDMESVVYDDGVSDPVWISSALYNGAALDVSNMQNLYLSLDWSGTAASFDDGLSVSKEGVLSMDLPDGLSSRIDLFPYAREAVLRYEADDPNWYIFDTEQNGVHFRIVFEGIEYKVESDGDFTFTMLDFHLLTAPIAKADPIS